MSKTSLGILVFLVGLAGAGWFGQRMRSTHDARELVARAEGLLAEGVEKAPTLPDLRATEARKLCEEAQNLEPSAQTQALAHAARAVELFARGEHGRAQQERGLARSALPNMPLLELLDVVMARERGEREQARLQIAHLLERYPANARGLLVAADLAREDGHSDEALALLTRALKTHPKASVLYEHRGLAHELLADPAAARADFEAAAKADRNAVAPLLHLGRMLRDAGDPRAAIFAFRSASQRDARSVDAHVGMGVCRNEIGDRVGARMDFEEAFALDPERVEPHLALGDLDLADQHLDSALLHYRRAVQLDKRHAAAWVKLGNALVRAHAADQAALAFQTAIKLAPDLAQAHNGLGAALLTFGDTRAAETELGTAAALDPRDPNPLLNLALLRKHSGNARGAEAALAQARERDPRLALASLTGLGEQRASAARRR